MRRPSNSCGWCPIWDYIYASRPIQRWSNIILIRNGGNIRVISSSSSWYTWVLTNMFTQTKSLPLKIFRFRNKRPPTPPLQTLISPLLSSVNYWFTSFRGKSSRTPMWTGEGGVWVQISVFYIDIFLGQLHWHFTSNTSKNWWFVISRRRASTHLKTWGYWADSIDTINTHVSEINFKDLGPPNLSKCNGL